MKAVLYIGCPAGRREEIARVLGSIGYDALWAEDAPRALAALERLECPVLVELTQARTLETARAIRLRRPWAVLIALADPAQPEPTASALRMGVVDVIANLQPAHRLASLLAAGPRRRPVAADRRAQGGIARLTAVSPAMRPALDAIRAAAARRDGVLICGEPGSGRRFVARAIFQESGGDGPLVEVECGGEARDTVEGVLFGQAAGNGHPAPPRGRVERLMEGCALQEAIGGTLLLVDAPGLPPAVQRRLLRLLADGSALVGEGATPVPAPLRVIATAASWFQPAASTNGVRRDLFRHVAATRIDLPPLRDRREDIAPLVDGFLGEICALARLPRKSIAQPALMFLAALPWRGNIRELRGLLDLLVPLVPGRVVRLADVLDNVHVEATPRQAPFTTVTLREARARFEREYITATLDQYGGRMNAAALALGIQRTNLYRKMRALGVRSRCVGAELARPGAELARPGADLAQPDDGG